MDWLPWALSFFGYAFAAFVFFYVIRKLDAAVEHLAAIEALLRRQASRANE
jgi:hypothetical protein